MFHRLTFSTQTLGQDSGTGGGTDGGGGGAGSTGQRSPNFDVSTTMVKSFLLLFGLAAYYIGSPAPALATESQASVPPSVPQSVPPSVPLSNPGPSPAPPSNANEHDICVGVVDLDHTEAVNAIVAGMRALLPKIQGSDIEVRDRISPVWTEESYVDPSESYWGTVVTYPQDGEVLAEEVGIGLTQNLCKARIDALCREGDDGVDANIRYCIMRGVTGFEGPHQEHSRGMDGIPYRGHSLLSTVANPAANPAAVIVFSFPTKSKYNGYDPASHAVGVQHTTGRRQHKEIICDFEGHDLETISDYVKLDHDAPPLHNVSEPARVALWAPATKDVSLLSVSISKATTYEYLVDHYGRCALSKQHVGPSYNLSIAARAAAKMAQLFDLATVAAANEHEIQESTNTTETFLTRPCLRCPDASILWPVDAGMVSARLLDVPVSIPKGFPRDTLDPTNIRHTKVLRTCLNGSDSATGGIYVPSSSIAVPDVSIMGVEFPRQRRYNVSRGEAVDP